MPKYELKAMHYLCAGKSCHRCEDYLPDFMSAPHYGEIQITDFYMKENIEAITQAIKDCPNDALQLINGRDIP